jgi:hypothetical protein
MAVFEGTYALCAGYVIFLGNAYRSATPHSTCICKEFQTVVCVKVLSGIS